MEARMVTLTPKPGSLDTLADFWDDDVVSAVTGCRGNRAFLMVKDRENYQVIGISVWDSADDAEAASGTFRAHMSAVGEHLAQPPAFALVEVAALSMPEIHSNR